MRVADILGYDHKDKVIKKEGYRVSSNRKVKISKMPNIPFLFFERYGLPKNLSNSKDYFSRTCSDKPQIFKYASDELKNDVDFMRYVLINYVMKYDVQNAIWQYYVADLRKATSIKEMIKIVIYNFPDVINFAPEALKNEIIDELLMEYQDTLAGYLEEAKKDASWQSIYDELEGDYKYFEDKVRSVMK